ncbi:hypothetical protein FSP39_017762 [Pinctada imbricata]|uniref:Uncharacterized protein n=1 Tax=Pinctada imbricata TaxID=66713 RepID=A0AA88XZP0_PINIB|nr:hypothetical protein FSP39_017762 [Pinctada imbricata]
MVDGWGGSWSKMGLDYCEDNKEESKKKNTKKEQAKKTKGKTSRQKDEQNPGTAVDVNSVLTDSQNKGRSENPGKKVVQNRDTKSSRQKNSKKAKVQEEAIDEKITSSSKQEEPPVEEQGNDDNFQEEKENDPCHKPSRQTSRKGKKTGKRNKAAVKSTDEAEKSPHIKRSNYDKVEDEEIIMQDDKDVADTPQIEHSEVSDDTANDRTYTDGQKDEQDGEQAADEHQTLDSETKTRNAADSTFTVDKIEDSDTKAKLENLTKLVETLCGRVQTLEKERDVLKNFNEALVSRVTDCTEAILSTTQNQEARLQRFETRLNSLMNKECISLNKENDLMNAQANISKKSQERRYRDSRGDNRGIHVTEVEDGDSEELLVEVNMLNDFCMGQKRLIRKLQNIIDGAVTMDQ